MNLVLPGFLPISKWRPPSEYPNPPLGAFIGFDTETKDPNLKEMGPGSFRSDGHLAGLSLALTLNDRTWSGYWPIGHKWDNVDPKPVLNYWKALSKREDLTWVGANVLYDIEWLHTVGINIKGKFIDIQHADPLLDEEREDGYSLEAIALRELQEQKDEHMLREAAATFKVDAKNDLWMLPPEYVGPYAEFDAVLPLRCWEALKPKLMAEDLMEVFKLECALIPLVWEMRKKGVRVDLDKADQLNKEFTIKEKEVRAELKRTLGWELDIWSNPQMKKAADQLGVFYPTTEKGNASFNKLFLGQSEEPFYKTVTECRNIERLRKIYVEQLIHRYSRNGRIHCQFHQMRRDDGGTRSGRFSSSNPNLQQIPSRDRTIAPKIRSLFLPEENQRWCKIDYSQQEPRILTHFGSKCNLTGVDTVREAYRRDRKTDFYTIVARAARLERKPAKDLTLGRCYGEGRDKIARDLGVSLSEADSITKEFDTANPWVKKLSEEVTKQANKRGWIRTITGRRRHFNYWEPIGRTPAQKERDMKYGCLALREDKARKRWKDRPLKRAFTYKALNSLIQGTAADMTKVSMMKIWLHLKQIPMLQVHDELNFSVDTEETALQLVEMMEQALKLEVPMVADLDLGDHWK